MNDRSPSCSRGDASVHRRRHCAAGRLALRSASNQMMPRVVAALIRIRTAQVAAVLLVTGAVLAPGVAASVSHAASSHSVVLRHNRFSPRKIVVHRGDTVTWLWRDGKTQHNVVSNNFHGLLNPKSSGSFTKRFTRSGSYSYFCTIHAGMTGTIVVH